MVKEMLSERQKNQILNKIFQDQASDLRIFKVEELLEKGKAQTFIEACYKIKSLEEERANKKCKSNFVAGQVKDLYDFLHKNNSTK